MLIEQRIVDGQIVEYSKVDAAIQWLRSFEPEEGYWVGDSGGKDSSVVRRLCKMAGVKFESHYSLTTLDPPELVRFIKDFHPDTIIDKPKLTMWQLIVKKRMPPTRKVRYCCAEIKELGGVGRIVVTGVRRAESVSRQKNRNLVNIGTAKKTRIVYNDDNDESRRFVEQCYRTRKTLINPIIEWLDEDVWDFIKLYKEPYCCLYDEGHTRLGCIGCPMSCRQAKDFERWPTYKRSFIRAFDRMIAKRLEDGMTTEWKNGQECFDWWVSDSKKDEMFDNQIEMEDIE